MLVHPLIEKGRLTTFRGSRLLESTLGVVGAEVRDPSDLRRVWTIQALYAPIPYRALGGVRARLVDSKDFVSFTNQRDLEVLLGYARPGEHCPWTGKRYVGPEDTDWCGLRVDEEDLLDDLHERELLIRANSEGPLLPTGIEILRRVHVDGGVDKEELLTLIGDRDPETGIFPDPRLETIERRWVRIEQRRVIWDQIFS